MIEFGVEAFLEPGGKGLQRWISAIDVCMTNRAHGNVGSDKQREVTVRAGFVSRKSRSRGIVCGPDVASCTGERSMKLAGVLRVWRVEVRTLRRCGKQSQIHRQTRASLCLRGQHN